MADQTSIKIEGTEFKWDVEKGEFLFEERDSVLFWITTAMKTFFDTIEEISGEESSNLVLEATGFRQGLVVGEFFESMKKVTVAEAAETIANTYAAAGWGRTTVENLDFDSKTVTVLLKDSWEHKINMAQGKTTGGNLLPAHFAGIFTGLFNENVWYKVIQYQLEGNEHTIINYFPSNITVAENIHQLARKKESEQIVKLERLVNEKTKELQELVKQISSPIIPVLEGIVVVPLVGKYDLERSEELVEKTLNNLPSYQANYLILDLTGLEQNICESTTSFIEKICLASKLIGTDVILVGLSSELSMSISKSNVDFSKFYFFQTLQHGIHYALSKMGRKIV